MTYEVLTQALKGKFGAYHNVVILAIVSPIMCVSGFQSRISSAPNTGVLNVFFNSLYHSCA